MTFTDEQLIELDGIGQRRDAFSFNLLNPDRTAAGALTVRKDTNPVLQVDTSRTSMRTLQNIVVPDPPSLGDNLGRLRVQPVMTLANGSQYKLGVLMFGEDDRNPTSPRTPWMPQLFDEAFLLSQNLDKSWSLPRGGSVLALFTALAAEILDPLGVPHLYEVDDVATDSDLLYPVGSNRNDALQALAKLMAALPPFFDNSGRHRLKQPPSIIMDPDHVYGAGTRIFKDSVTTKNTLYNAPNRYVVIGDNVGGSPVAAYYDLPDIAPHSAAQNGGNVITKSTTVPGVTDPTLAAQIAYVTAITDTQTYGTAEFDAAADPRHDIFQTVNLLQITYLEKGWSLTLREGGPHAHSLARFWG